MNLGDPTLDFLRRLDSEAEYEAADNVPVFVPHERIIRDKGGKEVRRIKVTPELLQVIADENNRAFEDRGVPASITIGHRDLEKPETQQPPIVGWAPRWSVGTFGPKNVICLFMQARYSRAEREESKKYPFRSVEFYPGSNRITNVALLKRDPFLDMGVVVYESEAADMPDDAKPDKPDTKPPGAGAAKPDGEAPDEAPAGVAPAGYDEFVANMSYYAKAQPWVGYAMKCYQASQGQGGGMGGAAAFPSATNTAVPAAPPGPPPPPGQTDQVGAIPMSADPDALAVRYAKIEQENAALKADHADLKRRLDAIADERDAEIARRIVYQLVDVERHQNIDRAKETAKLKKMTPAERDERVKEIRTCYQKDDAPPVAGPRDFIEVYSGDDSETRAADGVTVTVSDGELDKAVAYMRDAGIVDFNAALAHVRGGK